MSFSEIPVDIPNATDFFTKFTLLELTYPLPKTLLKMIFFCPTIGSFSSLEGYPIHSCQFMSQALQPHLCVRNRICAVSICFRISPGRRKTSNVAVWVYAGHCLRIHLYIYLDKLCISMIIIYEYKHIYT